MTGLADHHRGSLSWTRFGKEDVWERLKLRTLFSNRRLQQQFLSATVPPLLLTGILYTLQHTAPNSKAPIVSNLIARENEEYCHIDSSVQDTCTFVRENCSDFGNDGLIPYFQIYYCASPALRPFLLVVMFLWLMVLFASMATAAGEFLSIHLGFIVPTLGISQSLAGLTIFAFGNGSSDLFSTLAAMNANSGSLAISELFGAAAFITTVVLGLVAVVQPFSVAPNSFIGEVVWFIIAASSLTAFIADGQLVLGECFGIIGLYVAFMCFALFRPKSINNPINSTVASPDPGQQRELEDIAEQSAGHSNETARLLDLVDYLSDDVTHPVSSRLPGSERTFVDEDEAVRDESHTGRIPQSETTELEVLEWSHDLPPNASQYMQESSGVLKNLKESFMTIYAPIFAWNEQNIGEKIITLFSVPLLVAIGLTTPIDPAPVDDRNLSSSNTISPITDTTGGSPAPHNAQEMSWQVIFAQNWALCLQYVLGPQLFTFVFVTQTSLFESTTSNIVLAALPGFALTMLLLSILVTAHKYANRQLTTLSNLFHATFGFTVSLAWVYLTATSAVSMLTALGFILNIPNAILGATIFAIGNSSNDLVANTAVARRGFPVLAASACYGGPMMNMLLGIGGGGLIQVLRGHVRYSFEISASLFVSAASLLTGLCVTLAYAFWNSWKLDRRLGVLLIGIWVSFTVANVAVSM